MTRRSHATALLALSLLVPLARSADNRPAYPLDHCVVSGQKLGAHGDPYVFAYKGREVKFCCKACKKDFLKDPETYLKKIDEAAKPAAPAPAKS